jgi:TPR repeat protein
VRSTSSGAVLAVSLGMLAGCATTDNSPRITSATQQAVAAALGPESQDRAIEPTARLYDLGVLYASGRGGLRNDDREAARLFRLAADGGYAPAQQYLGVFYEKGRGGLPKNDGEAVRLFRRAADQGYAAGRNSLALCYQNGGCGLSKDDREAVRLYRLSADQGDGQGEASLAAFYQSGRGGLQQDGHEALRLLRLAADHGFAPAQAKLGYDYASGTGGLGQDDRKAAQLFQLSSAQGDPDGQAYFGYFYELGRGGFPPDSDQAVRWYRLAAAQSNEFAKARLAGLGLASNGNATTSEAPDPGDTIAAASKALTAGDLPPETRAALLNERSGAYRQKHLFDQATADLSEVLTIKPNLAEADLNFCRDALGAQKWQQAVALCTKAVERDPKDARAYTNRGVAYLERYQDDKAKRDFDEAVRLDPDLPQALLNRAMVHFRRGDYQRAISDLDQAIGAKPNEISEYYYERGFALYRLGKDDDAIAAFSDALRLLPSGRKDPRPRLWRARANLWKANYDAAISDCDVMLDKSGWATTPAAYTEALEIRADAYFGKGDYDHAIRDYYDAVRAIPNNPMVLMRRARAYRAKGDRERAMADERAVARLSALGSTSQDHDAGPAQDRSRGGGDAITAFSDALWSVPASGFDPRQQIAHARANFWDGNYDAVIHDCDLVLGGGSTSDGSRKRVSAGDYSEALELRADAFYLKFDYDKAIADDDEALRLRPDDPSILTRRGEAYQGKANFDRALADYNEALRLKPDDPSILADRSWAYRGKHDIEKALTDERAAAGLTVEQARRDDLAGSGKGFDARRGGSERATGTIRYRDAIAQDDKPGTPRRDDADAAYGHCLGYLRYPRMLRYALGACHDAVHRKPDFAEAHLAICAVLATEPASNHEALDDAVRACGLAIRWDPGLVLAYYFRGSAYYRLGQDDAAVADFTKIIRSAPRRVDFILARAQAYRQKRDYDLVITECTTIIKIDPALAEAYLLRADAYRSKGALDKATLDETRATDLRSAL